MIKPPTDEEIAALWWARLNDGEQELWRDEVEATPGVSDRSSVLACWKLYWSRGPALFSRDLTELDHGNCPVCRRRGFVIGPGAFPSGPRPKELEHIPPLFQLNIECAQLDCRMRFNVAFIGGIAQAGHHLGNAATMPAWQSEPVGVMT